MVKTKLSLATCKVLLGMGLALGIQSLYAQEYPISIDGNNKGDQGSFTRYDNDGKGSGDYTYNKKLQAGDKAVFTFNYSTIKSPGNTPNWYNSHDNSPGYSLEFNEKNEKIIINVGEGDIELKQGTYTRNSKSYKVEDAYNFNLTAKNIKTDIGLNAFSGESTIKGNISFEDGGMLIGAGGDDNGVVDKSLYKRGNADVELYTFRNNYAKSDQASVSVDGNLDVTQSDDENIEITFITHLVNPNEALLRVSKEAKLGSVNTSTGANTQLGIAGLFSGIVGLNRAKLISANQIKITNNITEQGILLNDTGTEVRKASVTIVGGMAPYYNKNITPADVAGVYSKNSGLLINVRTYHNDLISKLDNLENSKGYTETPTSKGITAIAKTGEFQNKEIKFQRYQLVLEPEDFGDIRYDFFTYYLSTDASIKEGKRQDDAKNLYISGGAAAGVLDNQTHGHLSYTALAKTIKKIKEWANTNGISIANSFFQTGTAITDESKDTRNNVEVALDTLTDVILKLTDFESEQTKRTGMLQTKTDGDVDGYERTEHDEADITDKRQTFSDGKPVNFDSSVNNGLFRLYHNIYVSNFDDQGRVRVDRDAKDAIKANVKYDAYQLVADRAAYDALNNSSASDKTALNFTRNDVFAQNSVLGRSVTGVTIEAKNQSIAARYLDNLESKLQGRTITTKNSNDGDVRYSQKDLHTQDVGEFPTSNDGGRTGLLVDEKGNIIVKDGKTVAYDNSKILDELALIKFSDGFGDKLGSEVTQTTQAIASAGSAISSVNSVINVATDISVGSRVAMLGNPYSSYAYKVSELKFATVASDMGVNYVDYYTKGIWTHVFGGANRIGGSNGGIYGLGLGFDKAINDNVILGAFFTYARAEIKDDLLKQKSNNFQLGLYSSIQVVPLWELNLKIFGQISPTDQSRSDSFGDLYSTDLTRKTLGLSANIGRTFSLQEDTFIIKPFVGMNYYTTHTPSYVESGNGNNAYKVDSIRNNNLSLELGTEFRRYFDEQSYFFITPKIEQYLVNNGGDFVASIGGFALPSISSENKKKTYAQAIIGGNFDLRKNFSANIGLGIKQILGGKIDGKDETYAIGQLGFKYKF